MIHQGKQSFSKFFQEEEINKLDLKKKKTSIYQTLSVDCF